MTQANNYDATAAMRQERLKRGESLPHRFTEKPAMQRMLPELDGQTVLMLGCGTGEESELLVRKGATKLVGIDASRVSIELAQDSYADHTFQVGNMNNLEFDAGTFHFVYSSLAINYTSDPLTVHKEVFKVLKPGGRFQFSVPHPVRWSSEQVEINGSSTRLLGFVESRSNRRVYGNYSEYAEYLHTFQNAPDHPLKIWVGPPSFHFNLLRSAGFRVDEFIETRTVKAVEHVDDYYYERFSKLPQFTLFQAMKV